MRKGSIKIGWITLSFLTLSMPFRAAQLPPAFGIIKTLVGEWVEMDPHGNPDSKVISSFTLTSGGRAIREVIFPGSDHEMITIYSLDADDLFLTHFCVLGNTPKYRAKLESDKRLIYECVGGANIASENDQHMHRGSLTIVDSDHIQTEWLQFEKGRQNYKVSFNLVRRK